METTATQFIFCSFFLLFWVFVLFCILALGYFWGSRPTHLLFIVYYFQTQDRGPLYLDPLVPPGPPLLSQALGARTWHKSQSTIHGPDGPVKA